MDKDGFFTAVRDKVVSDGGITLLFFCLLTVNSLLLSSCGASGGHFKMEGRFIHMNQGEMYVYSPDDGIEGMDTIKIEGGRFAYEVVCKEEATLVIVFPNFSEQPVFMKPGAKVEVKADASHLREMEATGTKDNKLMTELRKQLADASPPDEIKYAKQFIEDHPDSRVGTYLVRKYFLLVNRPDYKEAERLLALMEKEQSGNAYLKRMHTMVKTLSNTAKGAKLPAFMDRDVYGKVVSQNNLQGEFAIISVWSSWNYGSQEQQRIIRRAQRKAGSRMKALSICLDPSKKDCMQFMKNDTIDWPVICDELMIDGKTVRQLGLYNTPDNIILQNGRITDRGLSVNELRERLDELAK